MALPSRRSYAGGAAACTLSSAINSSATSFSISGTTSGWPTTAGGGFYMVIDPGLSTEEKVFVGARTTGSLSSVTRGVDGTLAASHDSGATCYPVFTAVDADEANKLASTLTTKGDLLSTDGSAPTRLGVGTNGQLLVADSAEASGVKWSNTISAATVISGSTAGELLRITQTGAGAALLVEDSTNPDSTPFLVSGSGNVFVGTTSSRTSYTGTGAVTPQVQVEGASTNTAAVSFTQTNGSPIFFLNNASTVASGNGLGVIEFGGGDGTALVNAARITAQVDGTPGTGSMPGRLLFLTTASGSATPTERMRIDSSGQVGIGGTPAAGRVLAVSKTLTGATTSTGISYFGTIQSDVTGNAYLFYTAAATQATAFTLDALHHFRADQATFGAGSAVTSQYGFVVGSSMTGATNNYGFFGNIASGTGRWNLYMSGTANNYLAGSLGIGTTSLTGVSLFNAKAITGATTSYGYALSATVQSDVTANAFGYNSAISTDASAFTLTTLAHFRATGGTIGATSAVTDQYGFLVTSSVTGATNNYAFYGSLASATGRYNAYMAGTASNFFAGRVGIGAIINSGAMAQVTNTTAADKVLVIKGAASQTGTFLEVQNSAATVQFVVDSSGRVGVGVGTPTDTLQLYNATSTVLRVLGDSTTVVGLRRGSADTSGPSVFLDKSRGTSGSPTAAVSGDTAGSILFRGYDGAAFYNAGELRGTVEGTVATGITPGRLTFHTMDSAGTATERMRISAAGDIGINMTGFSGAKVIAIGNGTAPTANPTGGGYLYVESGALKYRGSSGTITTIANA